MDFFEFIALRKKNFDLISLFNDCSESEAKRVDLDGLIRIIESLSPDERTEMLLIFAEQFYTHSLNL